MSVIRYFGCLAVAGFAGVFLDLHRDGSALVMALVCVVYAIDALAETVKASKPA